jgi:hypothetical protein
VNGMHAVAQAQFRGLRAVRAGAAAGADGGRGAFVQTMTELARGAGGRGRGGGGWEPGPLRRVHNPSSSVWPRTFGALFDQLVQMEQQGGAACW